ncbi:MAG: DUF748 domain-containing protein [Planctomycetota bacterium]|nr:DUF748 domain-containing protein [Planctomycetota bacterium]
MTVNESVVETKPTKRPWRKYFKRLALGLLILAVLLRLAVPLALPGILNSIAQGQGLQVHYSKLDLSLFTGSLELWDVSVRPEGGDAGAEGTSAQEPSRLGQMEFLTVDVDISALFGGTLRAHRVEIDGLDVYAKRESLASGWTWEALLPGETREESEAVPAAETAEGNDKGTQEPFDWSLGFEVSAIRLQHLQLHVEDGAVEPAFEAEIELNVRLSHLGLPETPARLEVFAHSLEFLDGFAVEGSLLAHGADLQVACQVDMRGLRPQALTTYLQPFGVTPLAHTIDCGLDLELSTSAANEDATALQVDAKVRDVQWIADGQELMALDEVTVLIPSFSMGSLSTETARIRGVRARAMRSSGGDLVLGGFRLKLPDGSGATEDPDSPTEPQAETESAPFALSIPELELSQAELLWQDESMAPSPSLQLVLDELVVGPLRHGAGQASEPIQIKIAGSAPGVAESLGMQGSVQAFAEEQTVDLELLMTGLKPERVAPYLHAAGLRSDFQAGSATAQIQAETHVDAAGVRHVRASVKNVRLEDGESLFALDSVVLKGLQLDPAQNTTRIEEVEVAGTRLKARRDEQGIWHAFGLAMDPAASQLVTQIVGGESAPVVESEPAAETQAEMASTPGASTTPARVELGRLACTDVRLELLDESMAPQVHQVFDDLGLELTQLHLGGDPGKQTPTPAGLELWFRADGLAQRLALQGTLLSQPGPLDLHAQLELTGDALELTALEPWLQEAGIESLWNAAQLGMEVDVQVQQAGDETRLQAELANLRFDNQGQTWLSMDALSVPSVVLSPGGITLEPIRIESPELLLRRTGDGALEALGLRIVGTETAPKAQGPAPSPSQGAPAPSTGQSSVLDLAGLEVQAVRVRWQDEMVQPAVDTSLRMDLTLRDLVLGRKTPDPMSWTGSLSVDDNLGSLSVGGKAWLDPADLRVQLQVAMEGLRAGTLGAYLPPNLSMELQDGRLSWDVNARFTEIDSGGRNLSFEARDLVFSDGEGGADLVRMPRIAVNVPELNPVGQRFDIQEFVVQGLVLPTRIDTTGSLHALGFVLDPSVTVPAEEPEPESDPQAAETEILLPGGNDKVVVRKAADRALPLVTLAGLDVGIERFGFVDERGGVPLDFGMRLTQAEPMTVLAPEAANLPALKFQILGSAKPIVESIAVEMEVEPYSTEPSLDAKLLIAGVRGDQLTRVLPSLAETLDGSAWTDGQVEAHLETHLVTRRRGPMDFDFSQGFGLEWLVDHVAVKSTADGPALLGFEELTASVASIRPATGDVHVKRIEWVNPHGAAWMDDAGLHAAGWVLKAPTPEANPDQAAESTDSVASTEGGQAQEKDVDSTGEASGLNRQNGGEESDGQEVGAAGSQDGGLASAPTVAGPEIRVDEVLISGGQFLFEDRTALPAFVFPIDDVDFQLKRFTTNTLQEDRPFSFRLALYGGEIELPERTGGGNLIGGILGSVAAIGSDNKFETEQRPVFDEMTLRGKMSLGPQPKGWTQMRLRGFELPAVRGLAAEAGVEIGDGLMGESTMLHFDGKGGLRVSSHTNFTYLSLSEPPGGPISSYLKLPAPLDTVLFVLKDEDGDHGIPLHLTMDEGGASLGKILGAVTKSLGLVIGEALASAPMRFVSGVVDLAGMGIEPIELTGDEWVQIPYGAGVVQAPADLGGKVEPLLDLLRRDPSLYLTVQHGLGSADVEQAMVLANPSREQCLDLASFYRSQRIELVKRRDDASTEVHAAYAMGHAEQARAMAVRLKDLDAELGRTESALDRVLERTRDQSDRAKLRRTKGAALEVSRRRMGRVEAFLRKAKIPSMGTRIDARRPRFSKKQEQAQGSIRISVSRRR